MDSGSERELPNKVHVFGKTVKLHHPGQRKGFVVGTLLSLLVVVACGVGDDPRELDGALARAASALAQRDAVALFRVIDQRARHAISSISKSRRRAAALIKSSYPTAAQAEALAELGDAAIAKDEADLFRMRCGASCLDGLAAQVGAPVETRTEGDELVVKTARGGELRMFRGTDRWYGIVWNTDALSRERARAAAEFEQVQANAALYAQQGQLKK